MQLKTKRRKGAAGSRAKMHHLHMLTRSGFRVKFSRAGGRLLLLDSAQTSCSFSWKLCYLLSLFHQLTGDIIYTLEGEECVFVCECWLTLRHHCKGPDQGLKGNFDPVDISPLGRVSFNHFQVIYQSTNQPERSACWTPCLRLFFLSEVVFPKCLWLAVVKVAQVVSGSIALPAEASVIYWGASWVFSFALSHM